MKIGVTLTLVGFSLVMALAGSTCGETKIVSAHAIAGLGSAFEGAPQLERRQTVPYSISTLLTRNLTDVFGENDPVRRRAAMEEIYTDDIVFYESDKNVYRGRDEIDRVAGALRTKHPEFRYRPIAGPNEAGNGGRIQWVEGPPDGPPEVAGTDIIVTRNGRIAAIYFFFDKLPEPGPR